MTSAEPRVGLQEWSTNVDAATSRDVYGITMFDVDPQRWHDAIAGLRDDVGLERLEFLTAVDEADGSLSVVAQVLGVASADNDDDVNGLRSVFVRTRVSSDQVLDSITDLYAGAAWHEREAGEMFGLRFSSGPTARLLLGEQLPEHPMLKSFWLEPRQDRAWPGAKEPGESDADAAAESGADGEPGQVRRRRRRQATFGIRPSGAEEAR